MRTSKTVDGATTTYQYVGDKLYYLCAKDATDADDYEMYFFYDSYDKLTVLKYFLHTVEDENNVVKEFTYYVATNYFGDVVALYSGQGDLRVTYEYDAWGNIIAVRDADEAIITDTESIAHRNPIRYRSYCYDTETGLYYLQSRYYNAEIGRFLNSDNISDPGAGVLAFNTFMYCANNPVDASDPSGHWSKRAERVAFVASCVAVVAAAVAVVAACVAAPGLIPLTLSLLTISVAGFSNGVANASKKNSFSNGCFGGYASSTTKEIGERVLKKHGGEKGNIIGNALGTGITLQLNNMDPYSSSLPKEEIRNQMVRSTGYAAASNVFTGVINSGVDMANKEGCLMPGYTKAFGVGLKATFSILDDAISFIWEE